jgi:putative ubiquitin-RnfH superfamily antitoxin RatB of RatAB toxin-antitoxin module
VLAEPVAGAPDAAPRRDSPEKHCLVAYAGPLRQYLWAVALPADATIGEAIDAARRQARSEEIPWDTAPVGIFGERRTRAERPVDGDRIELYRPLRADPRSRRRAQSMSRKPR